MMRLAIIALLLIVSSYSYGQNFGTRVFSTDHGLPDDYVYCTLQDKAGFLWVATAKGLVKFDGQAFEKAGPVVAAGDFVYSATHDSKGGLWFGTFTGKIYQLKNGLAQKLQDSISGLVKAMFVSVSGKHIYALSNGNGIYEIKNQKLVLIPGTNDYQINHCVEAAENELLLATSEGLLMCETTTGVISKIEGFAPEALYVQKLAGHNNTFMVSMPGSLLAEVTLKKTLGKWDCKIKILPVKAPDDITVFYVNTEDNIVYASTASGRFVCLNATLGRIINLRESLNGNVNSVYKDTEGNIWLATTGKGLWRVCMANYDNLDLGGEAVFSIAEDEKGNYYFGTANGIVVTNTLGTRIGHITKPGLTEACKVTALYYDIKKILWVGTENHGLFLVNTASPNQKINVDFSSTPNISINAINGNNRDSTVQVCTNLEGVYIYEGYTLKDHFSVLNSLLHNNVYFSLKTIKGRIYYATHNTSFNFSEGKKIYEMNIGDNDVNTDFNFFAENQKQQLLIATNGNGIYSLSDTSVEPLEFNHLLSSRYCLGLTCDKADNIWIMQRYALHKYYSQQKVLSKVNIAGDDADLYFNQGAFLLSSAGDLLFGTNKNAIRFQKKATGHDKLPVPQLKNLWLSDTLFPLKDSLDLDYGKYNLKIGFSALCLKNSEQVTYSYMLEGRDIKWSEPTKLHTADFPNLSEGEYIFKLKAFNAEGFSATVPLTYKIKIGIPYWKKTWFWLVLLVGLVLIVLAITEVRTARLKHMNKVLGVLVDERTHELNLEKQLVEKKNTLIEEQNEEIRSSIQYAKRIQDAVLPHQRYSDAYSRRLFTYYRPRDIVSGDFYWYTERGNKFLVAVCDCTGHGVPGAFMSMIGTTLLNKIVLDKGITDPAQILHEMNSEISLSLKQEDTEVNDGMEAGICCIDFSTGKVEFAGARRSLIYQHIVAETVEQEEIKPDKFALGGFALGNKTFSTRHIQGKQGDMLYIFSDGIADQFDHNNSKRVSSRRIREFLNSISLLPLNEQYKLIDNFIDSWKGQNSQTDDILLLGIRL